jgi:hypothetical protein
MKLNELTADENFRPIDKASVSWFLSFILVSWGGVRLSPLSVQLVRRPLIGLLYQPRMVAEYVAFGGMRTGRGNRNARRKTAPVPLCSPQISYDFPWDRTRAAAATNRLSYGTAVHLHHRTFIAENLYNEGIQTH